MTDHTVYEKLDNPVALAKHIKECDLCDEILSNAMLSIQHHYRLETSQEKGK